MITWDWAIKYNYNFFFLNTFEIKIPEMLWDLTSETIMQGSSSKGFKPSFEPFGPQFSGAEKPQRYVSLRAVDRAPGQRLMVRKQLVAYLLLAVKETP